VTKLVESFPRISITRRNCVRTAKQSASIGSMGGVLSVIPELFFLLWGRSKPVVYRRREIQTMIFLHFFFVACPLIGLYIRLCSSALFFFCSKDLNPFYWLAFLWSNGSLLRVPHDVSLGALSTTLPSRLVMFVCFGSQILRCFVVYLYG
jgi:hypothetical protein